VKSNGGGIERRDRSRVEDSGAAATLKSSYLDPLWSQSRTGALIDPSKKTCGQF
jgi:hypothetical protein